MELNLGDYVNGIGLTDFKDQNKRAVLPKKFQANALSWNEIKDIPKEVWDNITELLKQSDQDCRDARKHNGNQISKVKSELISMMAEFGINIIKTSSTKTLYAPYENMLKDIQHKHNMNTHPDFNFSKYCVYDENTRWHESCSDAWEWFTRMKNKVRTIEVRYNQKREKLIRDITYLVENGMSTVYRNDDELTAAVAKMQTQAAIDQRFPPGTPHDIVHSCGTKCSHTHGNELCDCGSYTITYKLSGEVEWDPSVWYYMLPVCASPDASM